MSSTLFHICIGCISHVLQCKVRCPCWSQVCQKSQSRALVDLGDPGLRHLVNLRQGPGFTSYDDYRLSLGSQQPVSLGSHHSGVSFKEHQNTYFCGWVKIRISWRLQISISRWVQTSISRRGQKYFSPPDPLLLIQPKPRPWNLQTMSEINPSTDYYRLRQSLAHIWLINFSHFTLNSSRQKYICMRKVVKLFTIK